MKKPGIFLLAILLVVSLLCGCRPDVPDQTVSCEDLTITLPGEFMDMHKAADDGLDLVYGYGSIVALVSSEETAPLKVYDPELDALGYARLFLQTNKLPGSAEVKDGIPSFTYTRSADDKAFTYLCGVFQTESTFWVVQVYCPAEEFSKNQSAMWEIIASVQL